MDIAMNRRTFVGGAVAAGVAAATVKAAPLAQANENVVDADIAIVGGGMSGLVCALQAAQEGAHVVMLEKNATCGGNGLEILTETPVKELVIADDGTVCGVVAEDASGNAVRANAKAVVLATGGFQGNPQMMAERGYPADNCWDEGLPGSSDANNVNSGRIAAQHAVATYVK